MPSALQSQVSIGRLATIILSITTMGIGLHSHFQSHWVKLDVQNQWDGTIGKLHKQACAVYKNQGVGITCPSISVERYFVVIIITTFIISLLGLLASFRIDLSRSPFNFIDLSYHVTAAILLLIAAITYIVSAAQIDNLGLTVGGLPPHLRGGEKYAAGAITILQSVVYGVEALIIGIKSLRILT